MATLANLDPGWIRLDKQYMQPLLEFNKALPYKVLVLLLNSDLPGVTWDNGTAGIALSETAKALRVKALRLKNYLIYLDSIGLIKLVDSNSNKWLIQIQPLKNYTKERKSI